MRYPLFNSNGAVAAYVEIDGNPKSVTFEGVVYALIQGRYVNAGQPVEVTRAPDDGE